MNKTNCPNCGAPYSHQLNQCPYCGTIYFDMSFIDLDEHMPIFLKICNKKTYITMKAKPTECEIALTSNTARFEDDNATEVTTSSNVKISLEFVALASGDGNLFTMEAKK